MLSVTSEYALRSLTYLASQPKGAAVLGRDLAEQCDIPANYLSKILLALKNAGIIDAARGSGGGYSLHREPDNVRLIDVVALFEGTRAKPECLLGINNQCGDANPCSAHQAWRDLRNAYVHLLETTTLESISAKRPESAQPSTGNFADASKGEGGDRCPADL
jgi:Rrf2 family protein